MRTTGRILDVGESTWLCVLRVRVCGSVCVCVCVCVWLCVCARARARSCAPGRLALTNTHCGCFSGAVWALTEPKEHDLRKDLPPEVAQLLVQPLMTCHHVTAFAATA